MAKTKSSPLLLGAILLPILYFGVQIALAPTFPNYSPLTDAASLLGSDRSPYSVVFNVVALVCGVCGLAGAAGLFLALRTDRSPVVLNILIALAVAVAAAGCIWAGVYPLPDARHGANPTGPSLLAGPLLLCIAAFTAPGLKPWRPYFIGNLVLLAAVVLAMAGVIPIDRGQYGGLLQRVIALTGFGPIGVAGFAFWRRP